MQMSILTLPTPYGHWKDTGIRLGDAVKAPVVFLEMWNAVKKTDPGYQKYLPETDYQAETGWFYPYMPGRPVKLK